MNGTAAVGHFGKPALFGRSLDMWTVVKGDVLERLKSRVSSKDLLKRNVHPFRSCLSETLLPLVPVTTEHQANRPHKAFKSPYQAVTRPVKPVAISHASQATSPPFKSLEWLASQSTPTLTHKNLHVPKRVPVNRAKPLEKVRLSGIVYHAKRPMALIDLSGEQHRYVKQGESFSVDGDTVQVIRIEPERVVLRYGGRKRTEKILHLPDLVGLR